MPDLIKGQAYDVARNLKLNPLIPREPLCSDDSIAPRLRAGLRTRRLQVRIQLSDPGLRRKLNKAYLPNRSSHNDGRRIDGMLTL